MGSDSGLVRPDQANLGENTEIQLDFISEEVGQQEPRTDPQSTGIADKDAQL